MKFIVRTFILLLLVNGSLLYMHYNDAGSATATSDFQPIYSQEIEVMNRPDGLYIRHHFTGLSDVRHEIVWPKMSTERSCYLNDGTACSRLNENTTAFVEGESDRQSIMYVIPKNQLMAQSTLFENVFAILDQSDVKVTLLHLTDEMDIGGSWVTGLARIGKKKMDLVDYSLYMDQGVLTDLYWHEEELPVLYDGDRLSVLGPEAKLNIADFEEADSALRNIDAPHSTIVIADNAKRVDSSRFIVSEIGETKGIADVFLLANMYATFPLLKEEPLIAEVVASLLSDKIVGSEKARKMVEELGNKLTKKELEQIVENLRNRSGQSIDAVYLDDLIGEVTGFKTSFIINNNEAETGFSPLLLEDPRNITIAGGDSSNVSPIIKEGKTLYPVTRIMQELGYKVSANKQSLYIENSLKHFRFPLNELFYVYNERRYNVNSIPFERIGDEFYFDEATFIRIFLVEINKTDEVIDIVPIAQFTEEEK